MLLEKRGDDMLYCIDSIHYSVCISYSHRTRRLMNKVRRVSYEQKIGYWRKRKTHHLVLECAEAFEVVGAQLWQWGLMIKAMKQINQSLDYHHQKWEFFCHIIKGKKRQYWLFSGKPKSDLLQYSALSCLVMVARMAVFGPEGNRPAVWIVALDGKWAVYAFRDGVFAYRYYLSRSLASLLRIQQLLIMNFPQGVSALFLLGLSEDDQAKILSWPMNAPVYWQKNHPGSEGLALFLRASYFRASRRRSWFNQYFQLACS